MQSAFRKHLEEQLGKPIQGVSSLRGGDIHHAWKIDFQRDSLFMKANNAPDAAAMFRTEALGLSILRESQSIRIPEEFGTGRFEDWHYLLLEFIPSSNPPTEFWEDFGRQLASLHQTSQAAFGLDQDNYIGSLPQENKPHSDWAEFYIQSRLQVQVRLAKTKQLLSDTDLKLFEGVYTHIRKSFPKVRPALLHGDLWSGNFLSAESGMAVLIDPAVYFGHGEVDLAMAKLFGGFHPNFFRAYAEILPLERGYGERQDLYQMYYLLVHLNLFGRSYYRSVMNIAERYA